MDASSSLKTALLLAVALGATAAVPAPVPSPSLIPSRVGASVSFHYDANVSSPAAANGVHAVVTLTRTVNDRVTITVSPDEGQAVAVAARVQADGSFAVDPFVRRSGFGGGTPRQPGSDVPLDGPIGGLPGGGGSGQNPTPGAGQGPGQGQYPGQGQSPGRGQGRGRYGRGQDAGGGPAAPRIEVPAALHIVSALIATRPAAAARTWPFAVVLGAGAPAVPMSARLEPAASGDTLVVADGTGGAGPVHVEATFRGGRLHLARGSSSTERWTLTAL